MGATARSAGSRDRNAQVPQVLAFAGRQICGGLVPTATRLLLHGASTDPDSTREEEMTKRPNKALQRTTPGVTACAQSTKPARHRPLDRTVPRTATPNRLRPQRLRRP